MQWADVVRGVLQGSLGTQPLLPSQRPEKRVVALRPGSQALFAQPGPNPANENSAVLVYYQACHPLSSLHSCQHSCSGAVEASRSCVRPLDMLPPCAAFLCYHMHGTTIRAEVSSVEK